MKKTKRNMIVTVIVTSFLAYALLFISVILKPILPDIRINAILLHFIVFIINTSLSLYVILKVAEFSKLKKIPPNSNLDEYLILHNYCIRLTHHPEVLMSHEVKFFNKPICTGCYGTAIGLFLSIILFAVSFILYYKNYSEALQSSTVLKIFLTSGLILNILHYFKYILNITGAARFYLNMIFPVGIALQHLYVIFRLKNNIIGIFFFLILWILHANQRRFLSHLHHAYEHGGK